MTPGSGQMPGVGEPWSGNIAYFCCAVRQWHPRMDRMCVARRASNGYEVAPTLGYDAGDA